MILISCAGREADKRKTKIKLMNKRIKRYLGRSILF